MISYKALTRASITLQLIDDIGLYDSEIFSSNGLLLQPYDRSTTLTGVIYKNNKDITSEIKDIRWTIWSPDTSNYATDEEWNENHKGSNVIEVTSDEIDGKCIIQFEAYKKNKMNEDELIACSHITLVDINDLIAVTEKPNNPYDGQLWVDTSTDPATIWVYKNGKWNQIYLHCRTYQSLPNLKLCTPHCMNYTKLENAVISELQNICRKYLDEKKCKQIIDDNNNNVKNEIQLNKEKSNLAKAIEVLDFQIEKLYEDKLKCLINDNDFSRMYEKKVNERDSKNKKLEELSTVKFERNVIDYEKIIQDFLKKENVTAYMLNSLIEKIEIDQDKQVTIYYKFADLNTLS